MRISSLAAHTTLNSATALYNLRVTWILVRIRTIGKKYSDNGQKKAYPFL